MEWRQQSNGMFTGLGGAAIFHIPQPCLFVLFRTTQNPHGPSPSRTQVSDAEVEAEGSQHLPATSQKCDLRIRQIICCFFPTLGANKKKGLAMEYCTAVGETAQSLRSALVWLSQGPHLPTPHPFHPQADLGQTESSLALNYNLQQPGKFWRTQLN